MHPNRTACWILLAVAQVSFADEPRFLWVANSGEGTVSKVNASTGQEVARYASITREAVVDVMGLGAGVLLPWGAVHNPQNLAQDYYGNAWVTNLAPNEQPSATKFMNHEPNCIDRNGNLQVDTSREVNLLPGIQLSDPAEFLGEADECIAFTVLASIDNGELRALAIDRGSAANDSGHAWVGSRSEQAFYQLDGESGALLRRVPPSGGSPNSPFSAAIDGNGILWATHSCCGTPRLWRIDTLTGADLTTPAGTGLSCQGSHGITVDLTGKIWLGGYPCASAIRFNPANSSWAEALILNQAGWVGLGIGLDRNGNVWLSLALSGGGRVARIDTSSAISTGVWDNSGNFPLGAAVAFDGDIWTANAFSNDLSRLHLDPATLEPAPHPMTGNVVDLFPVGDIIESNGDFTGLSMHTVVRPKPPGQIFADGFYSGSTVAWSAAVP